MKVLGAVSIATLLLLLASSLPSYSQDRDETRPGQAQEEKDKAKHQDKSAKPQDEGKRDQPGMNQDERRGQPEATRPQEQQSKEPREQKEQRPEKGSEQKMERGEHQHPAAAQRGGGKHIPDDKFRASFGRPHRFTVNRVITRTTIVPNQTQFVYSGYTFVFLDPWPAEWAFTDECYIDFVDDEYFLFDPFHPGFRVALLVVE